MRVFGKTMTASSKSQKNQQLKMISTQKRVFISSEMNTFRTSYGGGIHVAKTHTLKLVQS